MPRSKSSSRWRERRNKMPMGDAMNDRDLIDYALGQADEHEADRIERLLAADSLERERIGRLRDSLHRLLDDGDWAEPPPGLARQTLAFVAKNRRRTIPIFDRV